MVRVSLFLENLMPSFTLITDGFSAEKHFWRNCAVLVFKLSLKRRRTASLFMVMTTLL